MKRTRKWMAAARTWAGQPARRHAKGAACAAALCLLTACTSLFPRTQSTVESRWKSYEEVAAAFDQIVPYQTRTEDLKDLGFHPLVSPNVKVLTYVEVMQHFMPNPAITKADLNPAVRACIEAQEHGNAFVVELSDIKSQRHGNLILDIFGFKRRTHESGWRFKGMILTTNHTVVYKLSSGDPAVSTEQKRIKPLGPVQEVESTVSTAAKIAY
jgi:hypothetical protein